MASERWVDIGVNLDAAQFRHDLADVVSRAGAAGVETLILTGTSLVDSEALQQLAERFQHYLTVGVHPHNAKAWGPESANDLKRLAALPRVCAIGECGLDFNRNFSSPVEQETAFVAQLGVAVDLSMPVFLHCRDANERLLQLLTPFLPRLPGAVLHCFTGNREELHTCLDAGLSIGITGWICDERRGTELLELLPEIPLDRLLLETDAPWLLPRDLRPKPKSGRNEPAFLPHIAERVAEILNIPIEQLAERTRENARKLFRLPI